MTAIRQKLVFEAKNLRNFATAIGCRILHTVKPEYQGMEIGHRLVELAIGFVKAQLKEGWKIKIVLVAAKGKESFYEKFGFCERPNEKDGAGMDLWVGNN